MARAVTVAGVAGPTLYEILGARPGASPEELRSAYLDRARQAHPDRWVDGSPADRQAAERSMQDITEAWRVLGDAGRRRRYDDQLGGGDARARALRVDEARFGTRADGTMDSDVGVSDPVARLVAALPWIAVVVVLGAIFIFTAYAVTGSSTKARRCVDTEGMAIACSEPGARAVVLEVAPTARCPAGTQPLMTKDDVQKLCVEG
ncbi:MAG: DnaJ domain-containing protein [Acidimicrobiales bacterium]